MNTHGILSSISETAAPSAAIHLRRLQEGSLDSVLEDLNKQTEHHNWNLDIIDELANLDLAILEEYKAGLDLIKYDESKFISKDVIRKAIPVPSYDHKNNHTPIPADNPDLEAVKQVKAFKARIFQNSGSDEELFLYNDINYRDALRENIPVISQATHGLRTLRSPDRKVQDDDKTQLQLHLNTLRTAVTNIRIEYKAQLATFGILLTRSSPIEAFRPPIHPAVHTPPSTSWNWKKIIIWGVVGAAIAVATVLTCGAAGAIAGGVAAGFAAIGGSGAAGGVTAGVFCTIAGGAASSGILYGLGKGIKAIATTIRDCFLSLPQERQSPPTPPPIAPETPRSYPRTTASSAGDDFPPYKPEDYETSRPSSPLHNLSVLSPRSSTAARLAAERKAPDSTDSAQNNARPSPP